MVGRAVLCKPTVAKMRKGKVWRPRAWPPYLSWQTGDQFTQETLDFVGVLQPITRCRHLRLFANENADAALLQRAAGVLIRAIIANENRECLSAFKFQRFQEPEHSFPFVPVD